MTEAESAEPAGIQECPFCIAEIPAAAVRCRFCAADVRRTGEPPQMAGLWLGGIVLVLIGIGVTASSAEDAASIGLVIMGVGGILLQVATIAWAVSLGMRDRDERRHVARYHNAWDVTS